MSACGMESFAARLLRWWDAHGRKDMPWQRERTPYRTWVSEIMLQQTQVRTVRPYYERFTARFPTVEALAGADLDEVLHLWSGLGYYARARNLHRAARTIVDEHGGVMPNTVAALERLPGIGRSTAAAIVAQGFDRRAAILDANVKRVLARRHRVAGAASSGAALNTLWRLAETYTPAERVADYTQAIMDLGATVCRRSKPRCDGCPVHADCQARAAGDVERYPEKAPRRSRRLARSRFFVVVDPDGACLVEQRPPRGIWGGLWSPPERDAGASVGGFLDQVGIDPDLIDRIQPADVIRHGFTHYDLDIEPVYVRLKARPSVVREGGARWIDPADHRLGLSTVATRLVSGVASLRTSGPEP